MENIMNELNEEALQAAAGGAANVIAPAAPRETITTNPQIFSGAGHANGETWIAADGCTMYMVKSGDTLFKIALSHNLTLAEVEQLNTHITNFKWIHPGDVIMLKRA